LIVQTAVLLLQLGYKIANVCSRLIPAIWALWGGDGRRGRDGGDWRFLNLAYACIAI